MLTRAVRQILLRIASRAPLRGGSVRILFPDGSEAMLGKEPPVFELSVIQETKLWRKLVFGGEIGFGEAYMQGLWTTSDLPGLLQFGAQNRVQINNWALEFLAAGLKWRDRRRHLQRRNTPERSKDNIHEHYDLGNNFFRLFLDETLTYSCAVFEHPGQDLAAAQHNKYRRMCQKASITPDDHILEIGTGWGEFALFAAQNYGCRVTSISLSPEQVALARKRVCEAGLESQVEVLLLDYRSVERHYDKIISIEMFEAVGAEYFTTFFQACEKALKPGGKLVLQVITVPERSFPTQKNEVSWVQKIHLPRWCSALGGGHGARSGSHLLVAQRAHGHWRTLRNHPAAMAGTVLGASPCGTGSRIHRTVHSQMGILSCLVRGGFSSSSHRRRTNRL